MKHILMILIISLALCKLMAFPVRLQSWDLATDVAKLNKLNISLDRVNHQEGIIIADLRDQNEYQKLLEHGFSPLRLPDLTREYYLELQGTIGGSNPMNEYHSIAEYQSFMQNIATQYPNICQLHQWGTSVQNRPLYIMKISDNAAVNEAEPELKLIASIHGDETVGYEMMIRTIELLCENYGTDPRITAIVDNTELWINPLYNPDGYALGQRYNANGVDLNRNYPMPTGITNPDGNPTAQENLAMIDFSNQHNFVSGINFHGGALVINYPWDYTYTLALDNDLIIDMALTYSSHNQPMYNSSEFNQGITNGAAWYVITGSMQDWNYGFTSNIELTAEISNIKWPPASQLDGFWDDNQESILSFIEYAQKGVQGRVMSDATIPLAATIEIDGEGKDIRTDPVLGDYHRILLPGTYTITARAEGHLPQSADIVVPASGHVTHDFRLESAQEIDFCGIVRDAEGYPISGANVILNTASPQSVSTDVNGCFCINDIFEGDYQLQVSAPGFALYSTEIQLRSGSLGTTAAIVLGESLFSDGFDTDLDAWQATAPWDRVQQGSNWVLTDSPSGNYANNANRSIRLAEPISLANIQNPSLSFKAKWDLESGYDYVYVEASATGSSNWVALDSFTGNQDQWTQQVYSLADYAGGNFYLRFRLDSDWYENADGIYIDDVEISGRDSSVILYGDADGDGLITMGDAQSILEYTVGNGIIPEIEAADLDLQPGVSTLDAYMVFLFTNDPAFRFPVQSLVSYPLEQLSTTNNLEGSTLTLNFDDSQDLHSFYMDAPYAIDWIMIDGASHWIQAENLLEGRFAMIGQNFYPTHSIGFIEPAHSFDITAFINGYESNIRVNPSALDDPHGPQLGLDLFPNYPNPFNPHTSIAFSLPEAQAISLKIYNSKGQLLNCLIDQEYPAGKHSISWDGRDAKGHRVSSGIYFYRLQTGAKSLVRKMVLSQ